MLSQRHITCITLYICVFITTTGGLLVPNGIIRPEVSALKFAFPN